ncbi:MAG TPA: membrane protein insertion efficiency factor YidD [Bdellovibrionota bacterium]|nr:membrane protein insertion efficiency factor YidD [Bdellovibrionota bacterium]
MGLAVGLVRMYQVIVSPFIHALAGPGWGCRFHPSCSEYAVQALRRHGFWRGGRLAALRLVRCGPWARGGFEPVP